MQEGLACKSILVCKFRIKISFGDKKVRFSGKYYILTNILSLNEIFTFIII